MAFFLFAVLTLFAEIVGTVGGFGSSAYFVPIANFYFDFKTVLGVTAVFHLFSNLSKIALFTKGLNKQVLLYIGVPGVLFVALGAWLSNHIAVQWLELILAIFLVTISLLLLIFPKFELKPNKTNSVIGGTLAGLFAGMVGTGGAVRGITMAAFNLEKNAFVATSAVIDMGIDSTRTVVYFMNGYITKEILVYIPVLLVASIVGTYLGKLILQRISQERFRAIALLLILIVAVAAIIKVLSVYFQNSPIS